jgi:Fic family protein
VLSFSYKHAEEITSLEEKNSATVHALEQTQIEAGQLKSSLASSLIQLAKTKDQLKEAVDRENSLKEELKKLQNERK